MKSCKEFTEEWQGAIHKLATKLLPSIKVADREKLRKNKEDDK
jgi:hypothetical protein